MNELLSVGIDIGTSTTQLVFSRIIMKNTVGYFTVPRISIVDKQVVYKSPVCLTPLIGTSRIDGEGVRKIVEREYRTAGYTPADVGSGAVIITGESARKENAAEVLEKLSGFAGDFVVSTAGPDLESVIAGKGSGAWQYSLDGHCTTVNLDIGGGTTNIVVFEDGVPVQRGCFDIGGRLIRLAEDGTVLSVSPAAARIAAAAGVIPETGKRMSVGEIRRITDKMAALLAQALGLRPREPLLQEVRTPGSSSLEAMGRRIDRVCFSGGVAECMYRTEPLSDYAYGDIGVLLARSVREGELCRRLEVLRGSETIRATVVGAGTYTTTISGSTITYADQIFPVKNVPALRLTEGEQRRLLEGQKDFLADRVRWFLQQSSTERLVLALPGIEDPDYRELKSLADTLADGLDAGLPPEAPVLVVLEQDMAKALGIMLEKRLGHRRKTACIDGIRVEDGDYVDMGKPLLNGLVVPVIVKTLLFG